MNQITAKHVAILRDNRLAFKGDPIVVGRPGNSQGLCVGFPFTVCGRLAIARRLAIGFNPAYAHIVPIQHHPIGGQATVALVHFHRAGIGGNALAIIQPGTVSTDANGGVGIQVKAACKGWNQREQQRDQGATSLVSSLSRCLAGVIICRCHNVLLPER
jgi:hypothetical protein